MVDLCEYLTVKSVDNPAGDIIEECAEFNGDLSRFVLVLEPDKVPLLKDWIRRNIRHNADHCIQMLDNDAKGTFNFLKRMRSIQDCTSEFVKDVGGIQEFIDKYSAITPAAITPEPEDTTAGTECDTASQEEEQCPPLESIDKEAATDQNSECDSENSVVSKKTVVEEIIHRKVSYVQDYDPELIGEISEGDIAASLEKLRELNDKIALGGLNPKFVLTNNDLEEVYRKVYTYPPEVFKSFILAYLKSVNSETERFRVSAVMDDFMKFIEG